MSRIPALLLGVVLLIGSISGILLETRYKGDPKAEAFFCRLLLCGNDLLQTRAYEKLAAGGAENLDAAIRLFEQVLDRDKMNPYRWCDLGDALAEAGQVQRAQSCFRKALELGPNIPAILMRAANFDFRTDDARSALPQTSHVLKMAPDYDQVVFSSYTRMNLPVGEALSGGIPEDKRAGQAYFRYLLSNDAAVADAERGWEWLGARSFTDDALAAAYLDFLVRSKRYAMASAAWAKHLGKRKGDYLAPNRLFNGGFESEFTAALFDWRITPVEGVEVARDSTGPQSGKFCLRLQFGGKANLDYSQVAQSVHAAPGTYRFQAFMKSDEISTDKGVGLRIFDAVSPARLDIRTEPFLGTHDWTRLETAITVPADTILNIQVVRPSSLKFDCKIKGTVWLDAVSLRRM